MLSIRELAQSIRDLRLPKDERRAAKAERAVEARMRAERDFVHGSEKRRTAADAERQRHVGGGPRGG